MSKKTFRNAAISTMAASATVAAVAPAAVSADDNGFSDVTKDHVHYDNIMKMAEQGIIAGHEDGTFKPYNDIWRGQMAAMLTNALDLEVPADLEKALEQYDDVDADSDYAPQIAAVTEAGIFKGSNGHFGEFDYITREQMATALVEAYDLNKYDVGADVDLNRDNISESHVDNVQTLANLGITVELSDYRAYENERRDQLATMIAKTQETVKENAPGVEDLETKVNADDTFTVNGEATGIADAVHLIVTDEDGEKVVNKEDIHVDEDNGDFSFTTDKLDVGEYSFTIMGMENGNHGTLNAQEGSFEVEEAAIEDVSAINANQIEVKFNQEVDPDSIFEDEDKGTLDGNVISIDTVGKANDVNTLSGDLSNDGSTLILTASEDTFDGKYVTHINGVKTIDGNDVEEYTGFFTADDQTRPEVNEVSYPDEDTAKVEFSEPIKDEGNVTLNGKKVENTDWNNTKTSVSIDLSSLDYEEDATVTFTGAKDYAGNTITPNPNGVNVTRPAKDETKPEVEDVNVVSDNVLEVTFSKELTKEPNFELNDGAVSAENIEKDEEGTTYTLSEKLNDGVNNLEVTNIESKSGVAGDAFSQSFIASVDEEAPVLDNSQVKTDSDGNKYLELNFDEPVTLPDSNDLQTSFVGDRVSDYVTHSGESFTATPEMDDNDDTVVNIPLQDADAGKWSNVNLDDGFVTDTSQNTNKFESTDVSFVRGEGQEAPAEDVELTKENVSVNEDNNITLTFDGKLKGASAVNTSNYDLEGAEIDDADLVSNDKDNVKVILAVKGGSVTSSGNYNLTVDGLKDSNDADVKVSNPYTVNLTENIAPELSNATVVDGQNIVLTFDEAVENVDNNDFDLMIDGDSKNDNAKVTGTDDNSVFVMDLGDNNELNSDELSSTISLETTDGLNITDENGNDLVDFDAMDADIDLNEEVPNASQ